MTKIIDFANTGYDNPGAPIKALLCFFAFWVVGRTLFSVSAHYDDPVTIEFAASATAADLGSRTLARSKIALRAREGCKKEPCVDASNVSPLSLFEGASNLPLSIAKSTGRWAEGYQINLPLLPNDHSAAELIATTLVDGWSLPANPNAGDRADFAAALDGPEQTKLIVRKPRDKKSSPLSGYFWAFARVNGSVQPPPNPVAPNQFSGSSYGGSQAGAILTYRVRGNSERNISAFGRVSTAIDTRKFGTLQEEGAAGMKIKPSKSLPLTIHAEQRFALKDGRSLGQAIYVAGGTGPTSVIAGAQLETYGQAGYVISDDSSYFFDGSATIQKPLITKDRAKLSFGVGAWAGGQENVRRLDVGPRLDLRLPVGKSAARISVDWRERVAGNARPDSGLAVTVSTGF